MFKDKLLIIKQEIDEIDKKNVMQEVVEEKLNIALETYINNLDDLCRFIVSQEVKKTLETLHNERRDIT